MSEFTTLMARDGHEFSAWLAAPAGKPRGAVVVIQEIFGVNTHIRAVTDSYAAEGYVAIAPAVFDRVRKGIELGYTPDAIKEGFGYVQQLRPQKVLLDLAASIAVVKHAGRVGVVGFCWGGKMAYVSACELPIACGIAYYGGGIVKELGRTARCPMLYHFGGNDTHIPASDIEQIRAADTRGTFYVYPGADHGFNCDMRPSFNAEAAQLARQRTLAFLAQHLRGVARSRSPSGRPEPTVMRYISSPDFRQDAERIGILLVNTGTPDSLELRDIRNYLAKFLSDPRVIELPRWLWQPVLHGYILRTRPRRSQAKYRKVWTVDGSPLLSLSRALRTQLASSLAQRTVAPFSVELGMLYSTPGVAEGLAKLQQAGAQRILVLPLFPQYCGATTGAVYDQVSAELQRWRWLPELRCIADYYEHPGFATALRDSVLAHWEQHGRTGHLLMSFHGIPEAYFDKGDPYFFKCHRTARLLADELLLKDSEWSVSFQSRLGPSKWLQPYTFDEVTRLPARGVDDVTVVCPGFAIDCLETLEEIAIENRQRFMQSGGRKFSYVPALNASASHVRFLSDLICQHTQGWTDKSWAGDSIANTFAACGTAV